MPDIEDCRRELVNYKLDEILDFYAEDFGGEFADEIENRIISEVGEENPKYYTSLEQKIIYLWFNLVNKVIDRLDKGLTKLPKTLDFSDITIELDKLRKKTKKNRINLYILKEIYFDDINKIKIKVKSRVNVEKNIQKNKREEKHKNWLYSFLSGVFMLILGYFLSEIF